MSKSDKFKAVLLSHSVNQKDFNLALNKWSRHSLEYSLNNDFKCICDTHYIHKIVVIKNNLNGNLLRIGKDCAHNIMLYNIIDSDFVRARSRAHLNSIGATLIPTNKDYIEQLYEYYHILSKWEYEFLSSILAKLSYNKPLTEKQLYWVLRIQAKLSKTQPNSAPYISRKEYLMLTRNNKQ